MSAINNNSFLESNLKKKLATGPVADESQLLHKNPLDRNGDGKVDLSDFSGRQANMAHHNPLDRNFDGRVDAKDFSSGQRLSRGFDQSLLLNQTAYVQGQKRASLVRAEPTVMETIQKDVVVHERFHPLEKEEIQPIIYREREQLDVKQVTQLLHETQIQPTIIQQRELPAERREAIVERGAAIQENFIAPSRSVDQTTRTQIVHAPIVNEVIKKKVIEEIQPVLERDIIQSTVIQNTQPIYEKIVEAPMVYRETIVTSQERGIVNGGSWEALKAQGFNLGSFQNSTFTSTTMSSAPLASETLLTSQGLKRRSLVEALPASYSYLNGADGKLMEQQMLSGNAINNAPLASKTVL